MNESAVHSFCLEFHQLFVIRLSENRPDAESLFLQLLLAVLHFFFRFAAASMLLMSDHDGSDMCAHGEV